MEKDKFSVMCPEKWCIDILRPGRVGMKKHKFDVTYPIALFMETALAPPEHEKYCVDISHPGRNEMHYVTHRSHQMQKHEFIITCPNNLFVESVPAPPELEK
jgi:hypothetical protein